MKVHWQPLAGQPHGSALQYSRFGVKARRTKRLPDDPGRHIETAVLAMHFLGAPFKFIGTNVGEYLLRR
ncbi:hypothetical protein [Methyloglobulus sp.]|uniref:hypothetical protein n=1 Tax=Methyloglobulus sp. TaxID=2518622 RepID=UPI0039895E70